jgi:hypothetical protein
LKQKHQELELLQKQTLTRTGIDQRREIARGLVESVDVQTELVSTLKKHLP